MSLPKPTFLEVVKLRAANLAAALLPPQQFSPNNVLTEAFHEEAASVAAGRAEAIRRLGKNWVLHPEYKWRERHSNDVEVWWKNRTLTYREDLPPRPDVRTGA